MQSDNDLQLWILSYIAQYGSSSTTTIAKLANTSELAIDNSIKALKNLGAPLLLTEEEQHQLIDFVPLQKERLTNALLHKFEQTTVWHLFTEIDSTNLFLKNLPTSNNIQLCCAETQTHGKGRFGRNWQSPFGENIYFSARFPLNCSLNKLQGLSLVVGLAVIHSLNTIDKNIVVKWPNDLFCHAKKLGGILLEVINLAPSPAQLIIGIGININSDPKISSLSSSPWCSLYELSGLKWDRNIIIADLYHNLQRYISLFLTHGLVYFLPEWQVVDFLFGKYIVVNQNTNVIQGIANGINELGQLIVQDKQGIHHFLSSGDASISKFVPS